MRRRCFHRDRDYPRDRHPGARGHRYRVRRLDHQFPERRLGVGHRPDESRERRCVTGKERWDDQGRLDVRRDHPGGQQLDAVRQET